MLGLRDPAPQIVEAHNQLRVAQEQLQRIVAGVQANCLHPVVAEMPYRGGEFLCSHARRRCYTCGLEEEGSHWSGGSVWSLEEGGDAKLGNGPQRVVEQVSRNVFLELR